MKNVYRLIIKLICKISPKLLSKIIYYRKFKKKLNLKEPKDFNEKLMWLKLNKYNSNKTVWECSDKYYVRKFAKTRGINDENLPNLLGTYNFAEEINFNELPNKFVLKCTHGCGYNIICENKMLLDKKECIKELNKWLNIKFGYESAETHYMHIKPRIICEEFIENNEGEFPIDYKVYCFNGKAKIILVCTNRKNGYKTVFYDLEWNRVYARDNEVKVSEIEKPKSLEKMIEYSQILSRDFEFVRVDFYEFFGKPILGEMTFTPAACLGDYNEKWTKRLGEWIDIKELGVK